MLLADFALCFSKGLIPALSRRRVRNALARFKHDVRLWRAVHLPDRKQRAYQRWTAEQSARRQQLFQRDPPPSLLSVITAIWDGSPAGYLRELADSIAVQNASGACEWLIVDNGCAAGEIRQELARLEVYPWIRIVRLEQNAGIVGGLRAGLEAAKGRYVMSVDGDDLLYPDALRTVAHYVAEHANPPLLYSDEDKTSGGKKLEPYLKPDWDPALMLNSPYVAHLGIVDRQRALELGAYTDPKAEGSADWDLFMRFFISGDEPVHIPEVLYSWRIHGGSTAGDTGNKSYIDSSQQTVLQRFVDAQPEPDRYVVELSPLFQGTPHFRIAKRSPGTHPTLRLTLPDPYAPATSLIASVLQAEAAEEWIVLQEPDLDTADGDWLAEAEALFELHADAVMLGGLVTDAHRRVIASGGVFGFRGVCGDPYRGRRNKPGYFGELWKRRSVSAVSARFAIAKASFLKEVLQTLPEVASVGYLGVWAGAHAMRKGHRILYSPFLGGVSQERWPATGKRDEGRRFAELNRDVIPDTRFYSKHFSRVEPFAAGL